MATVSEHDSSRPRLTVATIVRDDAEGLAETLSSVARLADEVLVLDTGSHDDTQDVARRHGAKLIERPWDDDFAATRNACYERTTGDWVLWLDSGETLFAESATAIRSLLASSATQRCAYRITVRIPPPSDDAQAEQIAPVRLVPRIASLQFEGRVRESLSASLAAAGIEIESSSIVVERGPREHDPARKLAKARRDLRLAQRDLADHGNRAEPLLAKGEACAVLGRHAEAIDLLRLAAVSSADGSATQLAAYGALLATLDKIAAPASDTLPVKIAVGLEALDRFPLDAQLLLAMGGYLQAQGQFELAARSFRVAWEHGTATPDVWHVADARALAASCLSLALSMLGRDDEALEVLAAALRNTTDETRLRRRLLETLIRTGRRDEALAEVDQLGSNDEKPQLRAAVRGACLAAAGNWIAAIAQLEPIYRQGCRDAICRRAYLNALLATGQKSTALRIAEEWLATAPDHPEALRFREAATGNLRRHDSPLPSPPPSSQDWPAPRVPRPSVRIDTAPASESIGAPQPLLPPHAPAASQPNPSQPSATN